eukprot:gene24577-10189_t
MPNLLVPSYIVSFAYVFGDVFDKGRKQFLNDNHKITTALIVKTFDTLLWQSLASVILPGWVIHKVVDVSANAVHRVFPGKDLLILASVILPGWVFHKVVDISTNAFKGCSQARKDMILGGLVSTKAIPVVLGLATIPFIVKPIDHAVEVGMDRTIRQTYKNICSLAVPVGMDKTVRQPYKRVCSLAVPIK